MNKKCNTVETQGGQVMLIVILLLLAGTLLVVSGIMAMARGQVRTMTELSFSKSAYQAAEGALEEVAYRFRSGLSVSAAESLTIDNVPVTTTSADYPGGKQVIATADVAGRVRTIEAILLEGDGASFSFGVQTDTGGIIMENNSSVNGNVYSNGSIVGANLNMVRGTAVSAGPTGFVDDVHATGSVYANNIEDSYIEGDAFYQTIDLSTTVDGTKYPASPDLATSSLPITDIIIDAWAAVAASSGDMTAQCTAAGGLLVFDADVTLGPTVIPCDVKFEKFPEVTISGVVWIQGDVMFTQGPEFQIDPAIGNKSVPIIVDNPSDRLTSGRVTMRNSGVWSGNGNRSYVLVVSRNESAELGGPEKAILIEQSNGGDLLVYAAHGEIVLQNNTDLTEITAYRVRLQNITEVNYDKGLASAVFTTGPGGTYVVDSWKEIE